MSKQVLFNADAGGGVRLIAQRAASGTNRSMIWALYNTVMQYLKALEPMERERAFLFYGGYVYRFSRSNSNMAFFISHSSNANGTNTHAIVFNNTSGSCYLTLTGINSVIDQSTEQASGTMTLYGV